MGKETVVKSYLNEYRLELSEKLGQHFLVDDAVVDGISSLITPGSKVIEIGAGIGHITEELARKASLVTGIEIDKRFEPILSVLQKKNPRIQFVFGNVLDINLASLVDGSEDVQIVGNLPFHITEPLLMKLIDQPVTDAIFIVGDNTAREIFESENDPGFGRVSLLIQTFFDARVVRRISRTSFYPQPRTDAALVALSPKTQQEISRSVSSFIFANLFRTRHRHGLVLNELKQSIVEASRLVRRGAFSKQEANQRERARVKRQMREWMMEYNLAGDIGVNSPEGQGNEGQTIISQYQALQLIDRMGIDRSALSKPFEGLDNQEIRMLVKNVRGFYPNGGNL